MTKNQKIKILITSSILFLGLFCLIKTSQASGCSTDINNTAICPPPTDAPILPAAGGKFIDPDFGTEIIRVTDRSDGENAYVAYSYWNLFNVDSTRFFINIDILPGVSDNTAFLYNFDKNTDIITKVGRLFPSGSGSPQLNPEGIIWSAKDPNILYGHVSTGSKLYKYNVVTKEYVVIKDFSTIWPGTYISQLSMDENDNVFAFKIRDSATYANLAIGVYDVSQDTSRRYNTPSWASYIDECQIDKSGRWVQIALEPQSAGRVVWDLETDQKTTIAWNAVEHAPGHYDQGYGKIVGADACASKGDTNTLRNLSNPKNYQTIFVGGSWDVGSHISWRNNDEQYAYESNYAVNRLTDAPLENEIIQIFLDGSGRYRRLAHHRSIYYSYYDTPRAAVDRLGKYIIYNSNWDNSGYYDIFILKIPSAFQASPDTTPPAAPSGVTIN